MLQLLKESSYRIELHVVWRHKLLYHRKVCSAEGGVELHIVEFIQLGFLNRSFGVQQHLVTPGGLQSPELPWTITISEYVRVKACKVQQCRPGRLA